MRKFLLALLLLFTASAAGAADLSRGQTIYVPVYSHIAHGNLDSSGKPWTLPLSVMLSIRNIDPANGLTVRAVRYYDTEGKLLREFYAEPKKLGPLQSTDVFVENKDMTAADRRGGACLLLRDPVDRVHDQRTGRRARCQVAGAFPGRFGRGRNIALARSAMVRPWQSPRTTPGRRARRRAAFMAGAWSRAPSSWRSSAGASASMARRCSCTRFAPRMAGRCRWPRRRSPSIS